MDIPTIHKVGMLFEGPIEDKSWNEKGYNGLLAVNEQFNVDIFFKENIQTKNQIIHTVDEFVRNGVNLIFGHGNIYGRIFVQLSKEYPKVHFVYFNGGYFDENVTSLNFNTHAMGFFSGMLAAKMSKSKHVGVIAAYEWQSEIEGFYEGVKFEDPNISVHINYLNSWNNEELALTVYERMREKEVDVFYPLSEYYSKKIISRVSEDNGYVIGYLEDQSYIDRSVVLTSTVQHVDKLYTYAAHKFNKDQLKGGFFSFDFPDGFISLSDFSDRVPKEYQKLLLNYIDQYTETNLLPNEL